MGRSIAFLSDFGTGDRSVGICHSVIRGIDATLPIIDLSHAIAPQDVRGGAIALTDCLAYLPPGAVVLAVVDPGVGAQRRAVAIETASGLTFVGPDNGLLAPAIELGGGAVAVAELSNSPWRIEPVSSTFHARDIFAPVAARLAAGLALA
ncbi:MAG: SAM-dependent chlorinase/fluorinase, partial [Solirubrobacterales bacterium]